MKEALNKIKSSISGISPAKMMGIIGIAATSLLTSCNDLIERDEKYYRNEISKELQNEKAKPNTVEKLVMNGFRDVIKISGSELVEKEQQFEDFKRVVNDFFESHSGGFRKEITVDTVHIKDQEPEIIRVESEEKVIHINKKIVTLRKQKDGTKGVVIEDTKNDVLNEFYINDDQYQSTLWMRSVHNYTKYENFPVDKTEFTFGKEGSSNPNKGFLGHHHYAEAGQGEAVSPEETNKIYEKLLSDIKNTLQQ